MPSIRSVARAVTDFFTWQPEPIPAEPAKDDPVGAPSTSLFGGQPDYREKKPQLATTAERQKLFDDIKANVAIVGTGVRSFYTLFDGITWRIVPDDRRLSPDDDREALEALCNRVERRWAKLNVPLSTVGRRQAGARYDGAAIQVWTAVEDDDPKVTVKAANDTGLRVGRCDLRALGTIEQWVRDEFGAIIGVWQRDPQSMELLWIPRARMIYTVDDQLSDNPAGTGLIRHVVTDVRVMGVYEGLEGTGYQTDMRGLPIGRAPLQKMRDMVKAGQMTEDDYRRRKGVLESILRNHVKTGNLSILLDSSTYKHPDGTPSNMAEWGIELVRGDQGSKYEAIRGAIEVRELRVARVVGQEHLFIGSSGNKGGFSQSKDRSKSFGQMVNSTAIQVAADIDRDLLRVELELMGEDVDAPIRCMPDASNLRDVTEAVDVVWKLSQSGAPLAPGDPVVNYLRALGSMPPAPELSEESKTALMQTQGLLPPAAPPLDPNKVDESGNLRQAPKMENTDKPAAKALDSNHADADVRANAEALAKSVKGVFVGIFPPTEVATALSLVGGSDATALHLTLCYLGKGLAPEQIERVIRITRSIARRWSAPTLRVTGSARFAGPRAHVALVDGANPIQAELASELREAGLAPARDYDFTGHLTLAFEDRTLDAQHARWQREDLAGRVAERTATGPSWIADGLIVAAGHERVLIPFGG